MSSEHSVHGAAGHTELAASSRRAFFKESCALGIGALTCLVPAAAGMTVMLDPLRHRAGSNEPTFVAPLSSVPEDGTPVKCSIVATRDDAWSRYANTPIGAVYLRRVGHEVQALNVMCPHAGCFVDFVPADRCFHCPCHNSNFGLDGSLSGESGPTPRPMDSLPVEIRNNSEIWVRFQNFRAGEREKIPV